MSRRTLITGMALLMALLLAAWGSDPADAVYTAAGDASHPDELTRTSTFRPDDDLNLVVTLNAHNRTLPVHVTFTDPQGATVTTDTVEAGSAASTLVLGLDFEAQGTAWPVGDWQATVFVDGDAVETVRFVVQEGEG